MSEKKTASQLGRLSRTKGQTFERKVAQMLTESTGELWKRRVRNHANDSDVVCESRIFDHISIECKHANILSLPAWWRQAQEQAGSDKIPVLIYRQTAGTIYVRVDARDVHSGTFPIGGRHHLTMEWPTFEQWLREQVNLSGVEHGSREL